ncbi:hypothetical protein Tco_0794447 [Tanacetum coccineum]
MTPETVQAKIDQAIRRQLTNGDGSHIRTGITKWIEKMESVLNISGCAIEIWLSLHLHSVRSCFDLVGMVDKYISGLPYNIYGNVKSAKPKTLDEDFLELGTTDLMDQKSAPMQKDSLETKGRLMIHPETTMVINNNPSVFA